MNVQGCMGVEVRREEAPRSKVSSIPTDGGGEEREGKPVWKQVEEGKQDLHPGSRRRLRREWMRRYDQISMLESNHPGFGWRIGWDVPDGEVAQSEGFLEVQEGSGSSD